MSQPIYVTDRQKEHLQKAQELTGSEGFMEDAVAIAAYEPGEDGELIVIAVLECFRGGRAEGHIGCVPGKHLTPEIVEALSLTVFAPEYFNLRRLLARVPVDNPRAQWALLKAGFEIEYRDRNSCAADCDAIIFSLSREKVAAASHTKRNA